MDNLHELYSAISEAQPKDPDSKEMKCVICQEKAEKKCSACKSVAYCCIDHQKLDWKDHKKVCQGFTIKKTDGLNMSWFATRDLKAGELLLEESPVLQAPSWKSFYCKDTKKCVTCGVKVSMDSARICSTCFWPVCSIQCEKNTLHMDNECKEFSSRNLKYPLTTPWPWSMLIFFIRASSIKARDPNKFKQLMSLKDFYEIPWQNQKLLKLDLPKGMYELLNRSSWLTRDEFRKLFRICHVNNLESECAPAKNSSGENWTPDINLGIYLKISRLKHSCSPNCVGGFGPAPLCQMKIRTVVSVTKGEELTINCYPWSGFDDTRLRQHYCQLSGFICKCKRCLDPTEFGTFLSGIKCFNCSGDLKADSDGDKVGFLVPANPLDLDSPDPNFECHRCHAKRPWNRVVDLLPFSIRFALANIQQWTHAACDDVGNLEILLEKYDNERDFKDHLHPNHWVIQRAMKLVIEFQKNKLNLMTVEELKKHVARLEHLLAVDDQLFPGWSESKNDYFLLITQAALVLMPKFGFVLSREEIVKLTRSYYKAEKGKLEHSRNTVSSGSEQKKLEIEMSLKYLDGRKEEFEQRLSEIQDNKL